MSGIFGIADPKRQSNLHALTKNMSEAMSHRDWFVSESVVDEEQGAALGRIGIGIFNQLPQPVWNSAGTIALVMAGELYNREALAGNKTTSDEQIALDLYESQGEQFADQLNGAFLIGIYDKSAKRILIANDRFGLYQLFYTTRAGRLIFAPEMKGILCDERFPREIDLTALAQYMRFQHVLGERTFFEDIHILPWASILTYDLSTGAHSVKAYWSLADIPYNPSITFEEAKEETTRLFRVAVERQSGDSFRPGVFLSGGLDSRTILGMIARRPVASLTYGRRDCRDVYYAERIARTVGSNHHWIDLPNGQWVEEYADFHMDVTEGYHSWIHAHGISALPQARQIMDVNLTGWGGGMFKGSSGNVDPLVRLAVDDMAFTTRLFYRFTHINTWPSLTEAEEDLLYCGPLKRQLQGLALDSFRTEAARYLDYHPDVRGEYFHLFQHYRRLTQNFVIFKRSHVEVRFPYFDYDFFDFIHSMPIKLRANERLSRPIVQQEMRKLAYIPYDHDEFLPTTRKWVRTIHAEGVKFKRRVNRHVKKIFTERHPLYADYEEYLRGDLREWAENILYDRRTTGRGIFDPLFMRSLMQRHCSGLEEWTIGKIAPLITYEMMLRRYYD